jgi:uncharacterized repeat protein (TIGR02543 family)
MVACGIQTVSANDECGFDHLHQLQMQDPAYAKLQMQKDQAIRNYVQGNQNARIKPGGCDKPADMVITLPVVIHVVNMSATDTLITKKRADSAMIGINQYFANSLGFGPDTKMRFALAQRDPNGNATSGVNYVNGGTIPLYSTLGVTYTSQPGASINDIFNLIQWDQSKYINVYIINNFVISAVNGLFFNTNLIVRSSYFNQNNRTFTHEMGHYFELLHTNSESICPINENCNTDGDKVCDTPPIKLGDLTSSSCYSGDASNALNNYMGPNSNNMRFTQGQKDRMRASLYEFHWPLVLSEVLIPVTTANEVAIDAIENAETETFCGNSFIPIVTLRNIGISNLSNCKVQVYVDGVLKTTTTITAIGLPKNGTRAFNLNPTPVTTGAHNIRCVLSEINGSASDYFEMNNAVCGDILFQRDNYNVSLASDYGTVTGDGSYPCGAQVNINSTPINPAQHVFAAWKNSDGVTVSTVANHSFIAQGPTYLAAWYNLRTYAITATSVNTVFGTVSMTGATTYGSMVSVSAISKTGYDFVSWTENGSIVSTNPNYSFTVTGNRNLIANFVAKTYSINVVSANTTQGTVTTTGTTTHGSMFTAKALRKNGFQFSNWTENGSIVSTDSIYVFSVSGNRNLVANFNTIITGISNDKVESLQLYPNPAQDWITLKGFQNNTITVYDLVGNIISQQEIMNEQINISLLPVGIYILQIQDREKTYTGRLLKQ